MDNGLKTPNKFFTLSIFLKNRPPARIDFGSAYAVQKALAERLKGNRGTCLWDNYPSQLIRTSNPGKNNSVAIIIFHF